MSETTAITPAISGRICQHMNKDHQDAILVYAQIYGELPTAESAQMESIDSEGMNLEVKNQGTVTSIRIKFDHNLEDAKDAHVTLIDLLQKARNPQE